MSTNPCLRTDSSLLCLFCVLFWSKHIRVHVSGTASQRGELQDGCLPPQGLLWVVWWWCGVSVQDVPAV